MVEKVQKQLEELREEIRIFKKNEKATYDMISLYECIFNTSFNTFSGENLVRTVISNLEDPEVSISYKNESIYSYIKDLNDNYQQICEKYKNIKEAQEILQNFKMSDLKTLITAYLSTIPHIDYVDTEVNMVTQLHNLDLNQIQEFLFSNIPITMRVEILENFLINNYIELLNYICGHQFNQEKVDELLKAFQQSDFDFYTYIKQFLINKEYQKISILHNLGIVDINSLEYTCTDERYNLVNDHITPCSYICMTNKKLNSFMDLYESDSYQKVSSYAKENDARLILSTINLADLPNFIRLKNCSIYPELIIGLKNRINSEQLIQGDLKELKNGIYQAIIHKATNKKEYKEYLKFAKLVMKYTDYQELMKSEQEKQEKEILLKKSIEEKRQEFSTLLSQFNEYCQETVPGKTLVKNVKKA